MLSNTNNCFLSHAANESLLSNNSFNENKDQDLKRKLKKFIFDSRHQNWFETDWNFAHFNSTLNTFCIQKRQGGELELDLTHQYFSTSKIQPDCQNCNAHLSTKHLPVDATRLQHYCLKETLSKINTDQLRQFRDCLSFTELYL